MEATPTRFWQAHLKREWADKQIDTLNRVLTAFFKTDFCKAVMQKEPDGLTSVKIVGLQGLPAAIPMIIGDAIHALNSSLDYALNEILGWQSTRATFPMGDFEELKTSFRPAGVVNGKSVGAARNAAIAAAVPGISDYIVDKIRPYQGSDNLLWAINKLDVRDKHRLLIPLVVPQELTGVDIINDQGSSVTGLSVSLINDSVVWPITLHGDVQITNYGKVTADIFFNEIGVLEGVSVLPTLADMSEDVGDTLKGLEDFLISVGWDGPVTPQ